MSYVSSAEPIKIGYLIDFRLPPDYPQEMRDDFTRPFELVFSRGARSRSSSTGRSRSCTREVEGLPKGSVKAVIDAFGELVDEGCLVVFGPHITDNAVPTREAIEQRFRVPAISVTGTEDWLGEWTFAFPQGSMTDEPIFWADLLAKGGHREVGVLVEQSLVGESYVRDFRHACRHKGIRIVAEAPIAQTAQDVSEPVRSLYDAKVAAIVHCGFGLRSGPDHPGPHGARLGSAPLHGHRVPERLAPLHHVERTPGLDRYRPVRRGQPRRPALPRPVSRRRTGDAPSTACRW